MPWTIDKALADDLVHLVSRDDKLGVYEFRVGKLATIISVSVGRLPSSNEGKYHRSHSIKTPKQSTAYHQSRLCWDDVPCALYQAISSITDYYRDAVKDGLVPDEAWLLDA